MWYNFLLMYYYYNSCYMGVFIYQDKKDDAHVNINFLKSKQSLTKSTKIMQCFQPDNNDNKNCC